MDHFVTTFMAQNNLLCRANNGLRFALVPLGVRIICTQVQQHKASSTARDVKTTNILVDFRIQQLIMCITCNKSSITKGAGEFG
jgi:hypothetical protein